MKFIFIFGPPAVGKMTVGHELEKITQYKLFHNHMTIDMVKNFFELENPSFGKLVHSLRMTFFRGISESDLPGVIFTGAIDFEDPESLEFVEDVEKIFSKASGEVCYVELCTDLSTRLERNKSPHRLEHKPSKRDIKVSEERLLSFESTCRFNSCEGEFIKQNYLKLDNTDLSASEVAEKVKTYFEL